MKPWQLSVLNSRTELANAPSKECTVLYFQKHCLVGQNWDWFEDALDWTITCDLERPDGHRIVMLCEAGTLAKQGMNNCGLGLCLNFLVWPNTVEGVPVHVLMRAFLDSKDIGEAKAALARAGHGQASHLLLADADGNHLSVELGNGRVFELQPQNEFIAHTNHYISEDAKAAPHVDGANSRGRLETALRGCALRQQKLDIDAMMSILLDEDHVDTPLCCPFEPLPEVFNFPEGTTATLVMDLPGRRFHVKKGPDRERNFEVFNV
jgi:isopenicillin-N N-acyltransferase-like protein